MTTKQIPKKRGHGICIIGSVLTATLIVAGICVSQLLRLSDEQTDRLSVVKRQTGANGTFPSLDLPQYLRDMAPLPDVTNITRDITVTATYRSFVADGKEYRIFVRETLPPRMGNESFIRPKQDVLFLHGAAFSSKTWENLGTLHLLAALGYRVVAVDLPGFGKSAYKRVIRRAAFMRGMVSGFQLDSPVLVAASMSGAYAMPYLFDPTPPHIGGLITIAPVGTQGYTKEQYFRVKIPALLLYGEDDIFLGTSSLGRLIHLPNSYAYMLPDAGHPAYLDQPRMFHKAVYNFLEALTNS